MKEITGIVPLKRITRRVICFIAKLQVVAKGMVARGDGGAIVNVSSQASKIALKDHLAYCASKSALDSVTRMFALELGPHKVNKYFILFG